MRLSNKQTGFAMPPLSECKPTINSYGDIVWRNIWGNIHRENDLPAAISPEGAQYWYKDGELHRDGGLPAVIWANGNQYWHKNGKLHRDGALPAVIYADGTQEWYKDGIKYDP